MSKTIGNGKYVLTQRLGSGSFAQVYLATKAESGETFAIKAIARNKLGDVKIQENLDSEIMIMRDYIHPNIVRLFEHYTSANHIYLVLEYCAGGDLQQYIRKFGRLDERTARRFLIQLARGLQFLHSKHLIHRDIKPQNLLLTEMSDTAIMKIADFGFAKQLTEAAMAHTPCGTPLYMAPEILELREYDAKADLWSVGCVLFEMLSGSPPFRGSNSRELYINIKSKNLRLPKDVKITPDLLQLIQMLLERNPSLRITVDLFVRVCENIHMMSSDYDASAATPAAQTASETTASPTSSTGMRRTSSREHLRQIPRSNSKEGLQPEDVPTRHRPVSPGTTSAPPQRGASMTPATATMIMGLAAPTAGQRPSSATKRSIAESPPKAGTSTGSPQQQARSPSEKESLLSMSLRAAAGAPLASALPPPVRRHSTGTHSSNVRGAVDTRPPTPPVEDGDDGDDFVLVDALASHPWKTYDALGVSPKTSLNFQTGNMTASQANAAHAEFDRQNVEQEIHRCEYFATLIVAIITCADRKAREALNLYRSLNGSSTSQQSTADEKERNSPPVAASAPIAVVGNRPRTTSFTERQIVEHFTAAFSLYLYVMTMLRDLIQHSASLRKNLSDHLGFGHYIDTLCEGLSKRFDMVLTRADNCRKWIKETESLPVAQHILYEAALQLGQEASVQELLGNLKNACELYKNAKSLVESVLITASDPSDRRVLSGFAQMFAEQFAVADHARSVLEGTEAMYVPAKESTERPASTASSRIAAGIASSYEDRQQARPHFSSIGTL